MFLKFLFKNKTFRKVFFGSVIAVTLGLVLGGIAFTLFDNFTYYVWYLSYNEGGSRGNPASTAELPTLDSYFSDSFEKPPTQGSAANPSITDTPIGGTGLNGMYTHAMYSGYYAEMLSIIRDHCSWAYMNPACTSNVWEYSDGSEVVKKASIATTLGALVTESGTCDGTAPYSLVPFNAWSAEGPMNLSTMNSLYLRANPSTALAKGVGHDLKWDGSYLTPWQFSSNYFGVFPGSDGESATWFNFYPSMMNGFGVEAGKIRERRKTDAAYFPDQVSVYLQYTIGEVPAWLDLDTLTDMGAVAAMYPFWNGGTGIVYNTWGCGGYPNSDAGVNPKFQSASGTWWKDNGNIAKDTCATEAVNIVGHAITICMDYAYQHPSELNWSNHSDYSGMAVMAMLQEGGFIASQQSYNQLLSDMQGAGFLRGALLAYKAYTGDVTATTETVKEYFASQAVIVPSVEFYGPVYTGKSAPYSEVIVHLYSDSYNVYNNEGQGPSKLLHCYNEESLRGAFMSYMAGQYTYWRMLISAGVEVTFADALKDSSGTLCPGGIQVTDQSGNSYYFGTRKFGTFIEGAPTISALSSPIYYRILENSKGMHVGEDFVTKISNGEVHGRTLCALSDAQVTFVGTMSGYGKAIKFRVVDSGASGEKPLYYIYAHLYSYSSGLKVGDLVSQGDVVGVSGGSGTDDNGALVISKFAVHLHLTFMVEETVPGQETALYVLPFKAIYDGIVTPYNSPRMVKCAKDAEKGTVLVYDRNMRVLGCVRSRQEELYPNKPGSGWWDDADAGYTRMGPLMFLQEALKAG